MSAPCCNAAPVVLAALLLGCAPREGGEIHDTPVNGGENLFECGFTTTTVDVPSETVPDLAAMLGYLADLDSTLARWWDGAETELSVELDTVTVPALVPQTTYIYDPATSGPGSSAEGCREFKSWSVPLSVLAAGTSDGLLTVETTEVELGCAHNPGNGEPPVEGFPDAQCETRVSFALPVELDPSRVPPGETGPFSARVTADAPHEGALIAHVYGATGSGELEDGITTAQVDTDAILWTLTP